MGIVSDAGVHGMLEHLYGILRQAKADGLAAGKGWYDPDPVTYVRRMRDEWEERALEREGLIDRGTSPTSSPRGGR